MQSEPTILIGFLRMRFVYYRLNSYLASGLPEEMFSSHFWFPLDHHDRSFWRGRMHAIDSFDRGLTHAPDAAVVLDHETGLTRTYRETSDFTHRFAHAVRARGLGSQSRIVLIAANSALMYDVVLGAIRSEAIYFPINYRSSRSEIDSLLELVGWDYIFYDEEMR